MVSPKNVVWNSAVSSEFNNRARYCWPSEINEEIICFAQRLAMVSHWAFALFERENAKANANIVRVNFFILRIKLRLYVGNFSSDLLDLRTDLIDLFFRNDHFVSAVDIGHLF